MHPLPQPSLTKIDDYDDNESVISTRSNRRWDDGVDDEEEAEGEDASPASPTKMPRQEIAACHLSKKARGLAEKTPQECREQNKKIPDSAVHEVLSMYRVKRTGERKNVLPEGQTTVLSQLLGASKARGNPIHLGSPSHFYGQCVHHFSL